jgi:hypothetical protein
MKTITETNRQLINAVVAEGLNKLPAGVIEKDFLVTEVLRELAGISIAEMDIVFCGGTCLSTRGDERGAGSDQNGSYV